MKAGADSLQFSGLVVRSFVRCVKDLGLEQAVLARVPPDVVKVIRSPPFPTTWVPLAHGERICDAVHAEAGREAAYQLGYRVARDGMGPVLMPFLKGLAAIFKNGPAEIFERADSIVGLNVRGMHFRYQRETDHSGLLEMTTPRPLSEPAYVCFGGNVSFCFDVVDKPGTVIFQDVSGGTARYEATW